MPRGSSSASADEHAGEEAEHRPDLGAAQQRHADDDDEHEVRAGAEDADVGRDRRLQQRWRRRAARRAAPARRPRAATGTPCSLTAAGRVHRVTTMTRSSVRKSTTGATRDALVELDVLRADALDLSDGDAAHEDRALPAGGHDELAGLDRLALVDVLQRELAGDAAGDADPRPGPGSTSASTKLCWSVSSGPGRR